MKASAQASAGRVRVDLVPELERIRRLLQPQRLRAGAPTGRAEGVVFHQASAAMPRSTLFWLTNWFLILMRISARFRINRIAAWPACPWAEWKLIASR